MIINCAVCQKTWKTKTVSQAHTLKTVHDTSTHNHYITVEENV